MIRAGGDNCARAVLVGACLAGTRAQSVPDEGIEKTDGAEEAVDIAIAAFTKMSQ